MLGNHSSFQAALNILGQHDTGVAIPVEQDDFFERSGPLPMAYSEQRRFRRSYFRKRAIIEYNGKCRLIYTMDLSRSGVAFLFDQQLFPLDEIDLWLESHICVRVQIARCRRVEDRCFECGARMLSKREVPENELLSRLLQTGKEGPAPYATQP